MCQRAAQMTPDERVEAVDEVHRHAAVLEPAQRAQVGRDRQDQPEAAPRDAGRATLAPVIIDEAGGQHHPQQANLAPRVEDHAGQNEPDVGQGDGQAGAAAPVDPNLESKGDG